MINCDITITMKHTEKNKDAIKSRTTVSTYRVEPGQELVHIFPENLEKMSITIDDVRLSGDSKENV